MVRLLEALLSYRTDYQSRLLDWRASRCLTLREAAAAAGVAMATWRKIELGNYSVWPRKHIRDRLDALLNAA